MATEPQWNGTAISNAARRARVGSCSSGVCFCNTATNASNSDAAPLSRPNQSALSSQQGNHPQFRACGIFRSRKNRTSCAASLCERFLALDMVRIHGKEMGDLRGTVHMKAIDRILN